MHNFELNEEQGLILETARQVAAAAAAHALDRDEHRQFAAEGYQMLVDTGLLGMLVGADAGGAGFGMLAFAMTLETIAESCGATARLLLSQGGLCAKALEGSGQPALGEILQGKPAAFVGPESAIRARAEGDGFVLEGRSALATGVARAELLVVAARLAEEPAVFVLDAAAGRRQAVPATGFRASAPGAVDLTGSVVPKTGLAAAGAPASVALAQVERAALIGGGAIAVGLGLSSYAAARRHAHERIAFGKPLAAQQAVRHKLVEALRKLQAARHLVWHAARLADAGQDAGQTAMFGKIQACEAALFAADEGIQIHGGFGYVVEYHVERHYRDVQALAVMERGSEALRDALAAQISL